MISPSLTPAAPSFIPLIFCSSRFELFLGPQIWCAHFAHQPLCFLFPLPFTLYFVDWLSIGIYFKCHCLWEAFTAFLDYVRFCLAPLLVVRLLSPVLLFAIPCTAARQVSLSFTVSQSLLELMSIESMMSHVSLDGVFITSQIVCPGRAGIMAILPTSDSLIFLAVSGTSL